MLEVAAKAGVLYLVYVTTSFFRVPQNFAKQINKHT